MSDSLDRLTLEDFKKMWPCSLYSEDNFYYSRKLFNGRGSLDHNEIFDLPIESLHKSWVLLQMLSIDECYEFSSLVMSRFFDFIADYILFCVNKSLARGYFEACQSFEISLRNGYSFEEVKRYAIKCRQLHSYISCHSMFEFVELADNFENALFVINNICIFFIGDIYPCEDREFSKYQALLDLFDVSYYNGHNLIEYNITLIEFGFYLSIIMDIFNKREKLC